MTPQVRSALCFVPRRRLQHLQSSTTPDLPNNASAFSGRGAQCLERRDGCCGVSPELDDGSSRAQHVNVSMPDRSRHAFQVGGRNDRGDRKRRPVARRSAKRHRCVPCIDPKKDEEELDAWIEQAKASLVASLANGVMKDRAAVCAAIISTWSNGQTEGQITKLKLVKRQMYGRAKIDLLEARLIGAC